MLAIQRYDSPIRILGTVMKRVGRWLARPKGARRTHFSDPTTQGPKAANLKSSQQDDTGN